MKADKKLSLNQLIPILAPVIGALVGLLIGGLLIMIAGANPQAAYAELIRGAFGGKTPGSGNDPESFALADHGIGNGGGISCTCLEYWR